MWHKAEWMRRPMRLELTRVGLLVKLANRYTTKGAHAWNRVVVEVIGIATTWNHMTVSKQMIIVKLEIFMKSYYC